MKIIPNATEIQPTLQPLISVWMYTITAFNTHTYIYYIYIYIYIYEASTYYIDGYHSIQVCAEYRSFHV